MPCQARIDAPGALHHVMVRGIERRKIFRDNKDRDNFVERLGNIIKETSTPCCAWALLPNHLHLLLRTGNLLLTPSAESIPLGKGEKKRVLRKCPRGKATSLVYPTIVWEIFEDCHASHNRKRAIGNGPLPRNIEFYSAGTLYNMLCLVFPHFSPALRRAPTTRSASA
jgi:REP element-mobilizing transposase RayT